MDYPFCPPKSDGLVTEASQVIHRVLPSKQAKFDELTDRSVTGVTGFCPFPLRWVFLYPIGGQKVPRCR